MKLATKRFLFAIISGMTLSLSSAYVGLGVYVWFGLVPLFFLINTSSSIKKSISESFIFILSYNLSFFIWILGVHPLTWLGITNTESLAITILIWISTAIFHSLLLIPVFLLTKFLYKLDNQKLSFISIGLIALSWVSITHLLTLNLNQDFRAIAIPLNQIVYSQHEFKELIQICHIIGAIGLEALIIAVNLILTNLFENQKNIRKTFILLLILFLSLYFYGKYEIRKYENYRIANQNNLISFAIIQANNPIASNRIKKVDPITLSERQETLSSQINSKVNLLLWSEGSVPTINKTPLQNTVFRRLSSLADVFIFGTPHGVLDNVYNSIDFMAYKYKEGTVVGFDLKHYFKNKLMPYGEYTPFYKILPNKIKKISDETIGKNYVAANDAKPINLSDLTIAGSLCSELLFPQIFKKQVHEGANLLLNLNDLSWFKSPLNIFNKPEESLSKVGEDWVKKLFFSVAVFRAVENKRELILVSNNGYSGLIKANGVVAIQTPSNRTAIIKNHALKYSGK